MPDLYIGLMSGTSMDGIDAALISFGDKSLEIIATHQHEYPAGLRRQLIAARSDASLRYCDDVPDLHMQVGECFRDAAIEVLSSADADASTVVAIGSHGQTLRHEPDADDPYSLQIGDPDIIATGTGITTIADFRRADIELGGQGAPLAPAFHEWLFRRSGKIRVVVNIGGIANITVLPANGRDTTGFDTGPGNTLLDAWIHEQEGRDYDHDGQWGASGQTIATLLERLMADSYFAAPAPKSTGFEHFNLDWLASNGASDFAPVDVQATLCQLTVDSISAAIRETAPDATDVLVCGGGAHNRDIMARLQVALPGATVQSTAVAGLDPDWVEAAAFAWLAMRHVAGQPGNLPSVTGAGHPTILGTVHRVS
jgi:anhydro-N-acetylmuramic acid kinase